MIHKRKTTKCWWKPISSPTGFNNDVAKQFFSKSGKFLVEAAIWECDTFDLSEEVLRTGSRIYDHDNI